MLSTGRFGRAHGHHVAEFPTRQLSLSRLSANTFNIGSLCSYVEALACPNFQILCCQECHRGSCEVRRCFDKRKMPRSNAEVCLSLLAGVAWLHRHFNDLPESWPALSVAQQRILATSLSLDVDKDGRAVLVRSNQARDAPAVIGPPRHPVTCQAGGITHDGVSGSRSCAGPARPTISWARRSRLADVLR
jgi:hypothetical protein